MGMLNVFSRPSIYLIGLQLGKSGQSPQCSKPFSAQHAYIGHNPHFILPFAIEHGSLQILPASVQTLQQSPHTVATTFLDIFIAYINILRFYVTLSNAGFGTLHIGHSSGGSSPSWI
jgi:hypothetical protein